MLSLTNLSRPSRPAEWDRQKAILFTVTLAATARVTLACRAAGMSRKSAYALRARDPVFAAAWEQAKRASAGKRKVRQAGKPRADVRKVTPCTRAAQSSGSSSTAAQAPQPLLADVLRARLRRVAEARRAADSAGGSHTARGHGR